ncbi:MAG: 3'-5' exonuclease [Patescibacteria group bacterium]|nr:3'-5' exonuclease [Patescibacteria group bacterium]
MPYSTDLDLFTLRLPALRGRRPGPERNEQRHGKKERDLPTQTQKENSMKLFFDTETSGKADFRKSATDPCQPRLVQLAAILTTDDCEEVSAVNLVIRPEGFEIPQAVSDIHGITQDFAKNYGLPVKGALGIFLRMVQAAKTLHAYNAEFDKIIIAGELARYPDFPVLFESAIIECEMKPMTDICRLPGKIGFKWPSLIEAHTHCFGKAPEESHDALADVRTIIAVHKWRISRPEPAKENLV